MKLKIDGKYVEVSFWSFFKCQILVSLATLALFYALGLAMGILSVIFG